MRNLYHGWLASDKLMSARDDPSRHRQNLLQIANGGDDWDVIFIPTLVSASNRDTQREKDFGMEKRD